MPKVTKTTKAPKKASPLLEEDVDTTAAADTGSEDTGAENEADNTEETGADEVEVKPKKAVSKETPATGSTSSSENVAAALKSDIEVTRIALSKEPTVHLMIPLNGEKQGSFEDIFINGYHMKVPKGVMSIVPMSVAELVNNKYNVETTVGQEFRLDLNPTKHDAL